MKRTLRLGMCLVQLFLPTPLFSQQPLSVSSRKQTKSSPAVDALWINVLPSLRHLAHGRHSHASYFDLQRDGKFVFAQGDEFSAMKLVRSGVISKILVHRAFQIVAKPSVLKAKDTDSGEPMLSDSDWVSIGLMIGGKVKAEGGWAYQ